MAESKYKAQQKYNRKTYVRFPLDLKPDVLEAFRAAMEKMGAQPLSHGDAGYQVEFLPGLFMQILVWEGDDEFPPNSQILFSDNFPQVFAAEDLVVCADVLISDGKCHM